MLSCGHGKWWLRPRGLKHLQSFSKHLWEEKMVWFYCCCFFGFVLFVWGLVCLFLVYYSWIFFFCSLSFLRSSLKMRRRGDLPSCLHLPRFTKRVVMTGDVTEPLLLCFVCSNTWLRLSFKLFQSFWKPFQTTFKNLTSWRPIVAVLIWQEGIQGFLTVFFKSQSLGPFCLW